MSHLELTQKQSLYRIVSLSLSPVSLFASIRMFNVYGSQVKDHVVFAASAVSW